MTPLTEKIIRSDNASRVWSARQLERLLGGSDARRYGQVNRALKAGELLKVRRGLYVLANVFRKQPLHPYVLAQQVMPGSYVSMETALSFHGWIPEAVQTVASMIHGGKSLQFTQAEFGRFEYRRMTIKAGYFLTAVSRHHLQQQTALIADPMRALLDMVYVRKLQWQGLDYLLKGLRIDEEAIKAVSSADMTMLLNVYQGKREQIFIEKLSRSLEL